MYNGDIKKDVWAKTIPQAFIDTYRVSKYCRKFARHNSRMRSPSCLSRRVHMIEHEAERSQPALHLVKGE